MKLKQLLTLTLLALSGSIMAGALPPPADTVLINGYVYTGDKARSVAEAVAIKDGKILFVGKQATANTYVGAKTNVINLNNQTVMPSMTDTHIHALSNLDYACDLHGGANTASVISIDDLPAKVKECIASQNIAPGEWVMLGNWATYALNQPHTFPTLRAALDAGSTSNPVFILGNDGHTYGANSLALQSHARIEQLGDYVPVNKDTLAGYWLDQGYSDFFNVDANGEPDGVVLDAAAWYLFDVTWVNTADIKANKLDQLNKIMLADGVTSIQDAWSTSDEFDVFTYAESVGKLNLDVSLLPVVERNKYLKTNGTLDLNALVAYYRSMQDKVKNSKRIKVIGMKIMLDGVAEFPTWTAAMLDYYKYPVLNADGHTVDFYVDPDSGLCKTVQQNPSAYSTLEAKKAFLAANRFYPKYCNKNYGILNFTQEELSAIVTRLDKEGIMAHFHVIGDRAARTALNAVAAARKANGNSGILHTLAHTEFMDPADVPRVGQLGMAVADTYSWIDPWWIYDVTLNPYINKVADFTSNSEMYNPNSYMFKNSYPFKGLKDGGAFLTGGSDAPVTTNHPQPFVNMEQGVTRGEWVAKIPNTPDAEVPANGWEYIVQNPAQKLTLQDMMDAYTINGAKLLRNDATSGSIEVGKRANLAVLNQNVLKLTDNTKIGNTLVNMTFVDGKVVYTRPSNGTSGVADIPTPHKTGG
jgi:hypothetical protein